MRIRLLLDGTYGERVDYAVRSITAVDGVEVVRASTLEDCDLLAGTLRGSQLVRELSASGPQVVSQSAESFAVFHSEPALVVAGSDEQGLMYGLLELSDLLGLDQQEIDDVEPICESPETELRGIFTFLHNADCEEDWFHSRDHWSQYFDLLAKSRFNSFNLVLGHQTNYMSPPFPYFLEVPEHPEVKVPGLQPDAQRRNLESLRQVTELARARGLEFVLGIWQVIAWTEDSRGGHTQESLVDGLSTENLASYTYHATARMLANVPGIRGIQLRVNGESGVPKQRQTAFFSEAVFKALAEADRDVFLDLRGWLADEATIEAARSLDIPMRLSMKFWAEHLGPPYPAARQEPAYSYADFLRHTRPHPVAYQVWALGSHRHFVWGDPDYVRTFTASLRLGNATGFEISPPLAQKGFGNEPGAWRVLQPAHEYYEWEWERYWMFYVLFGRLTYDSRSGPAPWRRLLRLRLGPAAEAAEATYLAMSQVVSFILAFNMSDPNMYIWPEADTGGLLDFYMSAPPGDPARFEGISESARRIANGDTTARITAERSAEILEDMGLSCLAAAEELEKHGSLVSGDQGLEATATVVDARALGNLALYHAHKVRAALALALYYESGDLSLAIEARQGLQRAHPHWDSLAEVTDGFYSENQVTGPVDNGHWKERLQLVIEDEERLEERIELHELFGGGTIGGAVAAFDMGGKPMPAYSYTRLPVHHDMVERGFTGVDHENMWGNPLTSTFGWESVQGAIWSVSPPLPRLSDRHLDYVYRDTMTDPGHRDLVPFTRVLFRDYVAGRGSARFSVAVPAGTYQTIVVFNDESSEPRDHGPFAVSINGRTPEESIVLRAGESHQITWVGELSKGRITIDFASEPGAEWFCSAVVVLPVEPVATHLPPRDIPSGSEPALSATITSVKPVARAEIEVISESEILWLEMTAGRAPCVYFGTIPEAWWTGFEKLRYRFRIEDEDGRVTWLPAPDEDDPEPTFSLSHGRSASNRGPRIRHNPPVRVAPSEDVLITAHPSATPIAKATLNYRYANQYYSWNRVAMSISGNELSSVIPGSYVVPEWDIMYFIEMIDESGIGSIAPGADELLIVPYWVLGVDR